MNFPSDWFDDEVRDGFYVAGIVKREWAARMEVLQEISKVCDRHQLRWCAAYGTMLGAIRHHGYIPWDDDVDIYMPEDDYQQFVRYARSEFPQGFAIRDEQTPGFQDFGSVVGSDYHPEYAKVFAERFHNYPYTPGIDVFRLDYVSDNREEEERRDQQLFIVLTVIQQVRDQKEKICRALHVDVKHVSLHDLEKIAAADWAEETTRQLAMAAEGTGWQIRRDEPFLDKLFLLYGSLASRFKRGESSRMAYLLEWLQDPERKYNCYPNEMMDHLMKVPFEIMEVNVPEDYQYHLVMRFGKDYMKPVKAGAIHEYPVFRKTQRTALRLMGYGESNPFEYSFDAEDIADRPDDHSSPKEVVGEFLNTMGTLHQTLYQINQPENAQLILQVLESCQNAAVQIGDRIEEARGEDLANKLFIQEYADAAYFCYEGIVKEGCLPSKNDLDTFRTAFEQMKEAVESRFLNRKEIMFVPYAARKWNAMESLWRACRNDPSCDVYVVPAPVYEKNMLNAIMPEQHYDLDQYPEEAHAISYKDYDPRKRHPDYIFIQNPYDQYNYVTSVEKSLYSRALFHATDHLVYIPWFTTCEFGTDSHDDVAAMDFYVKVPGVVRADLTIVQSDRIADTYRQVLTAFAGAKTKNVWERKIQGWGSLLQDEKGSESPLWGEIQSYFSSKE